MRYEVTHGTHYTYAHEVSVSHHVARLTPRALPRQQCLECELQVEPTPALAHRRDDYFGNLATFLTVEGPHSQLLITARSVVEVTSPSLPIPSETPAWEVVRGLCREGEEGAVEGSEFVFRSPLIPSRAEFADYANSSFVAGRPILESVVDLTARIFREFKFDPKATTVATPLEQVLKERRGVCQDFAHFQIACLRSLGLPARYVSGYLETLPPPGKPKLVGADASHAWVQAWCAGAGWIDVDPTNNVLPTDRHITVAWGRDFSDVSPIRGVIVGGGDHELKVAVDVAPV